MTIMFTKHTFTMLAGVAAMATASLVMAQDYPTDEVKLLVNYGAGGSVDRTARSVQPFLPDALGAHVIVENVGGAGGKVGMRKFMQEDRDGYTVLTAFAPATTYAKFTEEGLFEMDDLAVINVQWIDPGILLAHEGTGWSSLSDFIEYARANPGDVTFGSSGQGSVGPILARQLFNAFDLDVRIVPYKGGGATRKAFAGGEVDLTAAGAGGATSIADSAVVLGLFGEAGSAPDWPDAPSINAELDAGGYETDVPEGGAYRFFAVHSDVKETYPERFQTLVDAFEQTVTQNAEFKARAEGSGVGTDWLGPESSQQLIKKVDQQFTDILQSEADAS